MCYYIIIITYTPICLEGIRYLYLSIYIGNLTEVGLKLRYNALAALYSNYTFSALLY